MVLEKNLEKEIYDLYNRGHYEKILQKLSNLSETDNLDANIWIIEVYISLNELEKAKKLLNTSFGLLRKQNKERSLEHFRILLSNYFFVRKTDNDRNKFDSIIHSLNEMYDIVENGPNFCNNDKLYYHLVKGLNFVYSQKQYVECINYLVEHLSILQESSLSWIHYNYYYLLTMRYWDIGSLIEAIRNREKSLEIGKKLKNEFFVVSALNGIGVYNSILGNYEKSMFNLETALEICQNKSEERFLYYKAIILDNMSEGMVYYGYDLTKALNFVNEAEKIIQNLNKDKESLAHIFFCKIEIFLLKSDLESTSIYINKLERLMMENNRAIFEFKYKLAKAKLLMKKGRFKDKGDAILLLKSIIDSKEIIPDTSYSALIHLTSLLIDEYTETKDIEILNEIALNVDKAKKINDFHIKYEIHFLEAKLLLIKGKILEAKDLFIEITKECKKSGYIKIQKKAQFELERIEREQMKWVGATNDPITLRQKIQLADFQSYFNEILKLNLDEDELNLKINTYEQ